MRRLPRIATLLSLVLLVTMLFAAAPTVAAAEVGWRSWDAGLADAQRSQRPVLVDVYTDWCGWCKRMDADVYARTDVARYLAAHFVTIRLNAESATAVSYKNNRYTGRTLASAFGVSGYPTTLFLTATGEHLTNVPGYLPADRFLLLLRFIGDGHMDRGETWDDYVKSAAPRGAAPQAP